MTAGSPIRPKAAPVPSNGADADSALTQVVFIPQEADAGSSGASSGPDDIDPLRLLTKFLDVLQRRRRLALTAFTVALALGALVSGLQRLLHPVFAGSFHLLVSDPVISNQSGGSDQSALKELALEPQGPENIPVLIEVLRSPFLLQPIAAKLKVAGERLIDKLTIAAPPSGAQGVLEITLEWDNPREGQKILEALSKDYLAFSLRQRQEKVAQGLSFLDDQSPALVRKVVDLQEQLSNFRRRNDFIEPIKQGEAIQSQRQALEARMGELKQREAQLLGSMAAVRAGKLSGPSAQGSGAELAGKVSDLEKDLAEAEASYLPDSPQVRSLRDRLNEVRTLLKRKGLDSIEASLAQIRSEQAELERQDQDLSRRFASNPGLVKQYEAIQQRLDVARQNLTSYISTRENFRLAEAQRTVPWRVISPPRFQETPVKPDLRRNLLFSVALAVVAGGGAALLRDQFGQRYHNSIEVAEELRLPLLGQVPILSEEADAYPQVPEPLRNLATNLQLLPKGRHRRLILIASSDEGEGRSMVTSRLGRALADLGQRVLLVDADLQHPALHLQFGANNTGGFADLLTGAVRTPEELIHPVSDNLHLMSAGPFPGEASKRLGSEHGQRVLEWIRDMPDYDVVLFDSSPTLAVGDALLLSREVDGIVFVVGLELVERSRPAQAIERFRGVDAHILGVVTNRPSC
jgi:capsular exopolysaccharide synthesis family protein